MKLYYGSTTIIKEPVFGEGNPSNDYGLGFYLTDREELAKLWACKNKEGGFVITFDVDIKSLNVLRIDNSDEKSILQWITLLLKNRFDYVDRIRYQQEIEWLVRHFDVAINDYDLIVGYRADDSYFSYSRGFVSGDISFETLSDALKIGKLGTQYVLISKKAFKNIKYVSHYYVEHNEEYESFRKKTLDEYHELKAKENKYKNTFMRELVKKYGD